MRLYSFKRYKGGDMARIGGKNLMATVKKQLAIEIAKGVSQRIENDMLPSSESIGNDTRFVVSYNLITAQQEAKILELLKPMQTTDELPADVSRNIRNAVIAILLEPLSKEHPLTPDQAISPV